MWGGRKEASNSCRSTSSCTWPCPSKEFGLQGEKN